jgi:arylsulfatase
LDISGIKLPGTWPGRELGSISGISLAPILAGGKIARPAPIHLQFGPNRGLRDGDWKLVSFGGGRWELYNLATDRAELHDLSDEHPEIRERMSAQWHQMATEQLHIPERLAKPEGKKPGPHLNPKWSDYRHSPADETANKRKSPGKKAKAKSE